MPFAHFFPNGEPLSFPLWKTLFLLSWSRQTAFSLLLSFLVQS